MHFRQVPTYRRSNDRSTDDNIDGAPPWPTGVGGTAKMVAEDEVPRYGALFRGGGPDTIVLRHGSSPARTGPFSPSMDLRDLGAKVAYAHGRHAGPPIDPDMVDILGE
jgi:hypothetical protein